MISHFLNAVTPGRLAQESGEPLLLSYYHWRSSQKLPARAPVLVGDSGGFSVATKGAALDPRAVLRWQMRHTSIGYILDLPPYDATTGRGTAKLSSRLWPQALQSTLRNVERARPLYRSRGGFRWWGIIQGATREQQEEWYGEVANVFPFDGEGEGWAMRPYPNSSLTSIARCVRFAADKGIKRLHLLQTTGAASVAVFLGLAEMAGLEFVTYDSASAARESRHMWLRGRPRVFPVFHGHELREVTARGDTGVQDYMRSGKCSCRGCSGFPDSGKPPDYMHRLQVHNASVMRDNFSALAVEAAKGPERLVRLAAGTKSGAVLRAFEREPART